MPVVVVMMMMMMMLMTVAVIGEDDFAKLLIYSPQEPSDPRQGLTFSLQGVHQRAG